MGQVKGVVKYATNDLAIMIPAGNPKGIQSLKDLARPDIRLSMPNPQWEGVAQQISDSLRKAGGEELYQAVYQNKVKMERACSRRSITARLPCAS